MKDVRCGGSFGRLDGPIKRRGVRTTLYYLSAEEKGVNVDGDGNAQGLCPVGSDTLWPCTTGC